MRIDASLMKAIVGCEFVVTGRDAPTLEPVHGAMLDRYPRFDLRSINGLGKAGPFSSGGQFGPSWVRPTNKMIAKFPRSPH